MRLFHRHSWSTFTCTAREIEGIKLLTAKDIESNRTCFIGKPEDYRCPRHEDYPLRADGECRICNYKIITSPMPKMDDVLITYKVCLTCGEYDVTAQCGKCRYTVNKEYVKLKIQALKKEKEDEEMERLLNLGNPDYKPKSKVKPVDYERIIEEQKESISHLQTYLRATLNKLNNSLKNDGIWEAIPPKVRKELIAKYGERAADYEPVSMDDIAKFAMQNKPNN